jgi:hypothetical protein
MMRVPGGLGSDMWRPLDSPDDASQLSERTFDGEIFFKTVVAHGKVIIIIIIMIIIIIIVIVI